MTHWVTGCCYYLWFVRVPWNVYRRRVVSELVIITANFTIEECGEFQWRNDIILFQLVHPCELSDGICMTIVHSMPHVQHTHIHTEAYRFYNYNTFANGSIHQKKIFPISMLSITQSVWYSVGNVQHFLGMKASGDFS